MQTASLYVDGGYIAQNPTWHLEDAPWKANHIYQMITKHQLAPRSIAEIGCGVGGVIGELALKVYHRSPLDGCRFAGYDIAPDAIRFAQSHYAHTTVTYSCADPLSPEHQRCYDLLLCIDVIEHIPDYLGFLEQCSHKAPYQIYHIPLELHVSALLRRALINARTSVGHLHYFTAESALAALQDTGHRVLDWVYTESALSLFHHHPSIRRALANVPRFLISRLSEGLTARLLGGYSLLALCERSEGCTADLLPNPAIID